MPSMEVLTFVAFPCSVYPLHRLLTYRTESNRTREPDSSAAESAHLVSFRSLTVPSFRVVPRWCGQGNCKKSVELYAQKQQRLCTLLHTDWGGCSSGTSVFIPEDKRLFVVRKVSLPPAIPAQDFITAPPQCLSFSRLLSTSSLVSK